MLEIVGRRPDQKPVERKKSLKQPVLPPFLHEAPAVALISRDAYVERTSADIDQLRRETGQLKAELAELRRALETAREDGEQTRRFYAFLERETRQKSGIADEIVRAQRALKERLDHIQSKSGGNYHGYSTFEAVSKRLTELGEMEKAVQRAALSLKVTAGMLAATAALWLWLLSAF